MRQMYKATPYKSKKKEIKRYSVNLLRATQRSEQTQDILRDDLASTPRSEVAALQE